MRSYSGDKVKSANEVISTIDRGLEIRHSYFCQAEGCEDFSVWVERYL